MRSQNLQWELCAWALVITIKVSVAICSLAGHLHIFVIWKNVYQNSHNLSLVFTNGKSPAKKKQQEEHLTNNV